VNKFTGQKTRDLQDGEHISEDEKCIWDLGDPKEVRIVERIFEMKTKGMGDVPIADALNREGIPPPKRGRWKNKDQKWSGGTIRVILTNPCYCGTRIYNRHPQSHLAGPDKEVWFNPKEEWIITENAHPAIVTKDIFEMANQDRKDYKRKNRYFYSSPYLLSGLIVCSHCGFNFQGQNHSQKNLRHYEDSGYISKGKSVCTSYKINAVKVEAFVIKTIRTKILNSDLPKRLEEMLDGTIKHHSFERLENVEQFEKALSDNRIRMERLFTLYETGTAIEQIADRIKSLEKEKKEIEQQLEQARVSNLSRKEIMVAKAQVQYLMDNFEVTLKYAPVHIQKELLRKFVQRIVVDRTSDTIIVYLRRVPSVNNASTGSTASAFGSVEVRMKTNKKSKPKVKPETIASTETEESVLTKN
jgi:DNA-binding transcriptional MerR regulator